QMAAILRIDAHRTMALYSTADRLGPAGELLYKRPERFNTSPSWPLMRHRTRVSGLGRCWSGHCLHGRGGSGRVRRLLLNRTVHQFEQEQETSR
ncbi:MAG TPA: hypothetical protein VK324_02305, partial [Tepidisphaeraceae bacterium]|nr:hypothetical protein [Tepidisphaeraceae bacterium]